MKIKVLYISYDGMTDPLGQSQVLAYLRLLSGKEVSFTLLSFEKKNNFEKHKADIENSIKHLDIKWIPLPYRKRPPVVSTLKDLIAGWREIKKLFLKEKYSIVHCRGYIASLLGIKCKKKYGTKFIFDMRGWWADEKIESGNWNSIFYRPIYHYFKRKEKKFFSLSDHTVSLTRAGKNYIVANKLRNDEGLSVIPTCVDFDHFLPFSSSTRAKIRTELAIPERAKVLLYSGSLGGNYRSDLLFGIFLTHLNRDPNSLLLLLTPSDPEYISREIKKYTIPSGKVVIRDCRFSEMSKYLMAGDIGLIFYDQRFSAIGRSPTKLGEYWASGLPFISTKGIGDLEFLDLKYPGGCYLLENGSTIEFEKAFLELENRSADSRELLRRYAIDQFDIAKGVEMYLEIYSKLSKGL